MESETIGRYIVKGLVGRGAMATVYHASDPLVGRDVAIKMMSVALQDQPTFRARFEREVRTIASLEHAAIVPVYDFGEHNHRLYLVMRLMKGGTLADRIRQGALSPQETLAILRQISPAIEAAHARGIVHRDLKPANILFDAHGHAFLSDFGIVRISTAEEAITARDTAIGTPAYMSPEQIQGAAVDGRSDIYSLAIVLFQMLAGKLPYEAETPARVMHAQVHATVPDIKELVPTLPPACNQVLVRALAKRPEERYPAAGLFLAAFEEALHQVAETDVTPLSMTLLQSTMQEAALPGVLQEQIRFWRREGRLLPQRRPELPDFPRAHIVLPTPSPLPPEPERPPAWSPQSRTYNTLLQQHEELLRREVLRYQKQLQSEYNRAEQLAKEQRNILESMDPTLLEMSARLGRLEFWERRPGDNDFLKVRVATGSLPATFSIRPPAGLESDLRVQGARALAHSFTRVGNAPLSLHVGGYSSLHLGGANVREFANALLLRLAYHHAPQDLRIFVFAPGAEERWQWMKWLPHTTAIEDSGDNSLLAFSTETVAMLMSKLVVEIRRRQVIRRAGVAYGDRARWPSLVVLLDSVPEPTLNREIAALQSSGQKLQVHLLTIGDARFSTNASAAIQLESSGDLSYVGAASAVEPSWKSGRAEFAGINQVEEIARAFASAQLVGPGMDTIEPPERVSFTELFGATEVSELDFWRLYRDSQLAEDFSVPIGRDRTGEQVTVQLKGVPPGGGILVCGEPRSGRRNLLHNIALGISAAFSPAHIRLVVASLSEPVVGQSATALDSDFTGLQPLPHVESGAIRVGAEETALLLQSIIDEVDHRRREFELLESRLQRRVPNLATYNRFIPEATLPAIVLLIDGFTASWSQRLQHFFTGLGEQARSFGLHLVLGVMDVVSLEDDLIDAFPLRLCLRVTSEIDSQRIIGSPAAAHLPLTVPGRGFIWRLESGLAEKFQSPALNSPRPEPDRATLDDYDLIEVLRVQADGRRQPLFRHAPRHRRQVRTEGDVIAAHIVAYCHSAGYTDISPIFLDRALKP